MSTTHPTVARDPADAIFRRIGWRLLPLLTLAYIVNFLDRTNVGFAAITMNKDVGLTPAQFGYGAGTLFVGYCLFELPSNIALYRFGARIWLSRIMVSWGLISMATVFVSGPLSFYGLRFVLGAAEAGFFPGAAFLLAQWFPAEYRARIYAWFLIGIPASSLIGSPISGALLGLNGWFGLAGWQWLYLIEGAPAVILGVVLLIFLTDSPEQARWLSPEQKQLVRRRLDAERKPRERHSLLAGLRDRRVVMLALIQFSYTIGAYGVAIFLPLIIKQQQFDNLTVGLITAAPSLLACVLMVIWAGIVDRSRSKLLHLAAMCFLSGAGLVLAVSTGSFAVAMLGLTAVVVCTNAARAVLWTIPTRFLSGIAAAGGLALINSVGTLGGFVGPSIMGYLRGATGSFNAGLLYLAGFLFLAVLLIGVLKLFMVEE
ncbi:MAG: MFS transporter [Acetobacteraceae bacterium]|nr:MFS transporter [Acetobacteraceae bacterium]